MTVRLHGPISAPTYHAARQLLHESFGVDFSVGRDHDDCRVEGDGNKWTLTTIGGESCESLLVRAASDRQPVVKPLVDGRTVLVIPVVDDRGEEGLACGVTDETEQTLLLRLARSTMRSIAQQVQIGQYEEQLEDYTLQVSRDFEELVWLRTLAERIGGSQEAQDTEWIAASVFPNLRMMVQAEAIILVTYRHERRLSPTADVDSQFRITRVGETEVSDETVSRLIRELGARAVQMPVVLNDFLDRDTLQLYPNLDSCVLVPIANRRYQYGWLLAVNRTFAPDEGHLSLEVASYCTAEQEFGTSEAGLLESSAVFLASHARNADLLRQQELLLIGTVRAMINAVDARDPYTCGHSDRVALIARRLAQQLGEPLRRCEEIYLAGLLHDIGKIGVPDYVLLKPGRLSPEEFALIRKHPEIGYRVLRHLKPLEYVLPGVLHHHESVDGRGYPSGLKGEEIPFDARVIAVADAFDAMTSNRTYRKGMPFEKAEAILRDCAGTQWDRRVVSAFFEAVEDIRDICRNADVHTRQILHGRDNMFDPNDSIMHAFEAIREQQLSVTGDRPS